MEKDGVFITSLLVLGYSSGNAALHGCEDTVAEAPTHTQGFNSSYVLWNSPLTPISTQSVGVVKCTYLPNPS